MKKLLIIIASYLLLFRVAAAFTDDTNSDSNTATHAVEVTIPTIAIVDIYSTNGGTATIELLPNTTALEAGSAVDFSDATDNSLWLNYTSVIGKNQSLRNITVDMSGDALPEGVSLNLEASSAYNTSNGNGNGNGNGNSNSNGNGNNNGNGNENNNGNGNGNNKGSLGSPANEPITLSTASQNLITGIGSGYTGSGEDGHRLTYYLTMDNDYYSTLFAKDYNLLVTYTITGE